MPSEAEASVRGNLEAKNRSEYSFSARVISSSTPRVKSASSASKISYRAPLAGDAGDLPPGMSANAPDLPFHSNDVEKGTRDEKNVGTGEKDEIVAWEEAAGSPNHYHGLGRLGKKLLTLGVEERGIWPVPLNERVDRPYSKIFFVWFSMNFNILSNAGTGHLRTGIAGYMSDHSILQPAMLCFPLLPVSLLVTIHVLLLITTAISKLDLGTKIRHAPDDNLPLFLRALASVTNGNLSWTVGIVVMAVISLLVSFCGYTVLNWYERVAWIPVLVTFLVALGVGGKHLSSPPPAEPASAVAVLGFASTLAGFAITFSGMAADFSSYFKPTVSNWKLFFSAYLGYLIPIVGIQCFGAAVVVVVGSIPDWEQGYEGGNVGGLLEAMLHPVGGFGKFLTVLLSLSVAPNIAATFYSISINIQVVVPYFVRVPRYIFSVVATAIVVPISIVGAHRFYDTLVNFLGLIGYWASAFVAIVLVEHLCFRKSYPSPSAYPLKAWNRPDLLPSGVAAVGAGILSFGLVIPSMHQVWYVGPIAEKTGDIGFEVAFVVSGILYWIFRSLEVRLRGRV
ncbi:hypothetical protein NLJ89_g11567 [Agrocybe chaxingu]|uniref:Cytosine-purine permease n=1 Tax=Agrocybe chaxingu TaxID=84603 RepID=A0A9W8JNH5_9AGAR|nr:hypothetical protein NLJ89_g11567 [Agrocybe chaxingu]